jgi:hypothetical protein
MTLQLSAPYPLVVTTTLLPNPQLGDSEALSDTVAIRRAMDGTMYSYVKRGLRRKLLFDFDLSRMKALELEAFVRAYQASKVLLVDHLSQSWVGHLTGNPVELEGTKRALKSFGNERMSVRLEFEGEKQ